VGSRGKRKIEGRSGRGKGRQGVLVVGGVIGRVPLEREAELLRRLSVLALLDRRGALVVLLRVHGLEGVPSESERASGGVFRASADK